MPVHYASDAVNNRLESGIPVSRKEVILANMPLVGSIAKKHIKPWISLTFGDLVHEGVVGLILAVDQFNWRKRIRFCTYATWLIRGAIQRAIYAEKKTVSIDYLTGKNKVALTEFICDQDRYDIIINDTRDAIWRSLQKLTWREQVIIVLKSSILDEKQRTFKEIGALMRMRGSSVHRIYRQALKKLSRDPILQEL